MWWFLTFCSISLYSERKALEKELPDVKKKLQEGEADLKKAIEGEKKASEEVSNEKGDPLL